MIYFRFSNVNFMVITYAKYQNEPKGMFEFKSQNIETMKITEYV